MPHGQSHTGTAAIAWSETCEIRHTCALCGQVYWSWKQHVLTMHASNSPCMFSPCMFSPCMHPTHHACIQLTMHVLTMHALTMHALTMHARIFHPCLPCPPTQIRACKLLHDAVFVQVLCDPRGQSGEASPELAVVVSGRCLKKENVWAVVCTGSS